MQTRAGTALTGHHERDGQAPESCRGTLRVSRRYHQHPRPVEQPTHSRSSYLMERSPATKRAGHDRITTGSEIVAVWYVQLDAPHPASPASTVVLQRSWIPWFYRRIKNHPPIRQSAHAMTSSAGEFSRATIEQRTGMTAGVRRRGWLPF
jgi:hypothetical protein